MQTLHIFLVIAGVAIVFQGKSFWNDCFIVEAIVYLFLNAPNL